MPKRFPKDEPQPAIPGGQCGDYEGHGGDHTLLISMNAPWFNSKLSDTKLGMSGHLEMTPQQSPSPLTARVTPETVCTCWLGRPGALGGSSDERQLCRVHGASCQCGHLKRDHQSREQAPDYWRVGICTSPICECRWFRAAESQPEVATDSLTARVTPFMTCGDGCRDPIRCQQNRACLVVEVAKDIAAQQQPDLTARVTARLTPELLQKAFDAACDAATEEGREGGDQEAVEAAQRDAFHAAILAAIAPELDRAVPLEALAREQARTERVETQLQDAERRETKLRDRLELHSIDALWTPSELAVEVQRLRQLPDVLKMFELQRQATDAERRLDEAALEIAALKSEVRHHGDGL
jgi:hypothetical protein